MQSDNTTKFHISTDKNLLDIRMICSYLTENCYWAIGRSPDKVKKSIDHSLCFGVYDSQNKQVGFARIVTDYSVFAWIHDVFILPEYQNLGLSKLLMTEIMNHPELQNLQRWGLNTKDAHPLYAKFGFKNLCLGSKEGMMEVMNKPS